MISFYMLLLSPSKLKIFIFSGTMLTILSLMRTLDSVAHHKAIMNYLSKLVEVDPMRCNYYKDLGMLYIPNFVEIIVF